MALRARVAQRYSLLVNILLGVIIFANALICGAARFDPSSLTGRIPNDLITRLDVLKACAIISAPVTAIILAAVAAMKKYYGPQHIWRVIHTLLDDFRNKAFHDVGSPHLHRVTLFKYQVFCLKPRAWMKMIFALKPVWGGWLVPVDRSSDVTQNPKVVFSASKNRPELAEGFAGIIWKVREKQYYHDSPTLTKALIGNTDGEKLISQYCKDTNGDIREIKKRLRSNKGCPRTFWGVPIEGESGSLWGVLVIDSQSESLPDEEETDRNFRNLANAFKALLKHV